MSEDIDHEYTDEVVCPYCGYEFSDSWEFKQDSYKSLDCDECGEEFSMEREVTVSYSTEKLKELRSKEK